MNNKGDRYHKYCLLFGASGEWMERLWYGNIFTVLVIFMVSVPFIVVAGCVPQQTDETAEMLHKSRRENLKLKEQVQTFREKNLAQDKQIHNLLKFGDKRLDLLFHVTDIKLGKYTAGADMDEAPGHDGIRVYLTPIDRDGHAIKAAGVVKIQLFDLAADPGGNLIGSFDYPVEKIAQHWHAGLMAYYYRFDCRWKKSPKHSEITVRVEFTDYLMANTFTAQKVCKVRLPASPTTSTAPATQPGK